MSKKNQKYLGKSRKNQVYPRIFLFGQRPLAAVMWTKNGQEEGTAPTTFIYIRIIYLYMNVANKLQCDHMKGTTVGCTHT